MTNPRAQELLDLAASEGFNLPIPITMILWFEDHGCVVDLHTGKASRAHGASPQWQPTPSGKAVAHLLQHERGEVTYE